MEEVMQEIFNTFENSLESEEDGGLEIISQILSMPDDKFDTIKPVLLDSIEQNFGDVNAQIGLAQMLNQNGITYEDMYDNVDVFIDMISELSDETGELSETKIEFLKFLFVTILNNLNKAKAISHRIITIPIELCDENAKMPTYATPGSAAMDIYSPDEYTIKPGETIIIPTGIKVAIPKGYALLIQPRSGLSSRTKMRIPNTPGLIDADYHEVIGVIVENTEESLKDFDPTNSELDNGKLYGNNITIGKGERFAQMRLIEVPQVNWMQVKNIADYITDSDHGEGFGNTGAT